jgi:hypothetical protein
MPNARSKRERMDELSHDELDTAVAMVTMATTVMEMAQGPLPLLKQRR